MTDIDKDIMEFLNEQARSEDEGAKICRYAGKLLAMSQARSAKLRAAAERIRVLGEEVEAWRGMPHLDHIFGSYWYDYFGEVTKLNAARAATDAARRGETRELARNQPCGCVVCRCEDKERCGGCGAKNCGTHPVGQIPNAVYKEGR